MKWLLAGLILLLSSDAFAARLRWAIPPAKYVHPFNGKTVVYWHRAPLTWWDCGGLVYGCAFMVPGLCTIHVWRRFYNASLYRHELAHCNGWPYWHPPG